MRVLVVDDQAPMRLLVQEILQRAGYEVLAAESGPSALELAARTVEAGGAIDLLLTDVVMPEMSGPGLAEHMHIRGLACCTVFMTGYAPDAAKQHGLPVGAVMIQKPFTAGRLIETVERALGAQRDAGNGEAARDGRASGAVNAGAQLGVASGR